MANGSVVLVRLDSDDVAQLERVRSRMQATDPSRALSRAQVLRELIRAADVTGADTMPAPRSES